MKRALQRGMTLIELMVSLVVGSFLLVAVFGLMAGFEGQRRTLSAASGLDQTGSVAMFKLDQWIRSAGTGFTQASTYAYGCELFAAKSSSTLLPMSGALPAPFASTNPGSTGVFRLAPVLIIPGGTTPGVSGSASDVLVLMSGGNNDGQTPSQLATSATAAQLSLTNTMGFAPSDLALVVDQQQSGSGGIANCLLTQVSSSWAASSGTSVVTTLDLAGTWYAATVGSTSMTGYSSTAMALDLGGSGTSGTQTPSFQVVGVGDNNTLYAYDLLNLTGSPLQAVADNVFEMHALYGVDTDNDGKVDSWVSPSSGSYTVSALMAGTQGAAVLLKNIKAVRVGLILRTALPERTQVTTASALTLFSDLGTGVQVSRSLSSAEQNYRYRTVEATIPVRNNAF